MIGKMPGLRREPHGSFLVQGPRLLPSCCSMPTMDSGQRIGCIDTNGGSMEVSIDKTVEVGRFYNAL